MKKIKVGVVGVGYLGKFHTEKYANMQNVELVGISDIDLSKGLQIAEKYNTKFYQNYQEFFGKIDAASIVVPTSLHFLVSKAFLEHKINLLIEKPITTSLEDADILINIAKSNNLIIQVGHLERFNSAILALKDKITNPVFISSDRLSIYKPRCTDVSVVLDLMIHDIDIILNLLKAQSSVNQDLDKLDIKAVGACVISSQISNQDNQDSQNQDNQDKIDIANARIEFSSGCVANLNASRISMKNQRKIRIFQKDAYLSLDFANHQASVIYKCDKSSNSIIPGMEINNFCFDKGDALDIELKSFIQAVREQKNSEVTGEMGRDALKIALKIEEEIKKNYQKMSN